MSETTQDRTENVRTEQAEVARDANATPEETKPGDKARSTHPTDPARDGQPLWDAHRQRPIRWENVIPFNEHISQGTEFVSRPFFRWDEGDGRPRKRAQVIWCWRELKARRVMVETDSAWWFGDLVGFDKEHLRITTLGDCGCLDIAWEDLRTICDLEPV